MKFTPLRRTVIVGASCLAIGAAGGVAVHAATSSSSSTQTAASSSPKPSQGNSTTQTQCVPKPLFGAARQVLQIAASVTGQTEAQILDQLRQGRSLDQIAGSKASTIEQQVLDKLKARLDHAVSAGKLTNGQETDRLAKAKTALETAMAANLSSRIPAAGSKPTFCRDHDRHGRHGLVGLLVKVTAEKTGLTQQQVLQDLRNGQSIDQIAGSKAADIKATVLQMLQQQDSSLLDKIMSHAGLGKGGPGHHSFGDRGADFDGMLDGAAA